MGIKLLVLLHMSLTVQNRRLSTMVAGSFYRTDDGNQGLGDMGGRHYVPPTGCYRCCSNPSRGSSGLFTARGYGWSEVTRTSGVRPTKVTSRSSSTMDLLARLPPDRLVFLSYGKQRLRTASVMSVSRRNSTTSQLQKSLATREPDVLWTHKSTLLGGALLSSDGIA